MKRKPWISLFLILLNEHYGLSKKRYFYFEKKQRLWEFALIPIVIVAMVASLAPLYRIIMTGMLEQYTMMGMEALFLSNAYMLAGIFGFFLGIFMIVSTFFFSKDMNLLSTLPMKPWQIISAKTCVVLMDQMIISLALLLPPLIYFGVSTNASPLYWVSAVVVFLCSQIFPIAISMIVILPLAHKIRFNRYKDFMVFFLATVVVIAVLAFQYVMMQSAGTYETTEAMLEAMANPELLVNRISMVYPPAFLATKALTAPAIQGLGWLLIFLGAHIGLFLILLGFGNRFYLQVYSDLQEKYAQRSVLKEGELSLRFGAQKPPITALWQREWRYFLREPSFAFNGLGAVVIFPILILVMAAAGSRGSNEIRALTEMIHEFSQFTVPIGILLGTLPGAMNSLSSSLFSREGKMLKELRVLPFTPIQILKVKLAQILSLSMIGPIMTGVAMYILFRINFGEILAIVFGSAVCMTFLNLVQVVIDAIRPVLDWDNPHKAMKANLNVAFSIPIIFGFCFGLGFLGFLLRDVLPPMGMTAILFLVGIFGSWITWPAVVKRTTALFARDQ